MRTLAFIASLLTAVIGVGLGDEPPDDRIDLLIIAPQAYEEALQPFVEFKSESLRTEFAALESVLDRTDGVDDPAKLKRRLYELWKSCDLRYVLLVGDADITPVRYMVLDRKTDPAFNYAFYPSDLYYADLAKQDGSFETWNAQHDGFHARYFGEVRGEHHKDDPINFDEVDYRPEIAVGRWPVNSPDELRILIEKTIAYENSLRDAPGPPKAAFLACGGWIENRGMMDRAAGHLEGRFTIEKRYFANQRRDDGTPPPNAEETLKLINNGVRLIFHSGHGTDNNWHHSIGRGHIASMSNADRPAIMMSAGCSTARFATCPPYEAYVDIDGVEHAGTNNGEVFGSPPPPPAAYQNGTHNPTGLGEQLLRAGPAGAVAYIGCNTGSQPCGMTLLDGFAHAIGSGEPGMRLGDAWRRAIAHYWEAEKLESIQPTDSWYPASIFFQGMKFMLFGDPSLPLPISGGPED